MTEPVLVPVWKRGDAPEDLLAKEWLVTNALGGYASGTLAGICTRRYHGLLVAALPAPLGRTLYLPHVEETMALGALTVRLTGSETGDGVALPDLDYLEQCILEDGLPVWRYRRGALWLEKRIFMTHRRNTTCVRYTLLQSDIPVGLRLRPYFQVRPHEAPVDTAVPPCSLHADGSYYPVAAGTFPGALLRIDAEDCEYLREPLAMRDVVYRIERARGYDHRTDLASEGAFQLDLAEGDEVTLLVSTEPRAELDLVPPSEMLEAEEERRRSLLTTAHHALREGHARQLVLAADQFIVLPVTRRKEALRAVYAGEEARTVIAGYPWFTDWGRDTMISLEGLCLLTGRSDEAAYILRMFAQHASDGLIPNLFPEGDAEGLYHTADATMWFFHAVDRYITLTGDRAMLRMLLPRLEVIMQHHLQGTRFGISADPADGLLAQGAEGYQLTWMDAKVDGWVVTPRRGKAVEINALFYNALRLLGQWCAAAPAQRYLTHAERVHDSFNRRFWSERHQHLLDVVDGEGGDDAALRPNQLLAVSLPHPVLDERYWRPVLKAVSDHLLTPMGLRTLAPGHPDYKPTYDGDLRSRDAAYHQGTVWPWLLGPYVDAWLRVNRERPRSEARRFLEALIPHLNDCCGGTINEIFDADPPFRPRGCLAQAWSVAEVLRGWALTEDETPGDRRRLQRFSPGGRPLHS